MKSAALALRSLVFWILSLVHFGIGATLLALFALAAGQKRADSLLKIFCRNIVLLSGARYRFERSSRIDARATYVFVANHVNVFDPFMVGAAIRQPVIGFELESHFKVPIYGLMMKAFGNVPVPDRPSRAGILNMRRVTGEALECGNSLILFAEGTRTRTGLVGPFRAGALRMVAEFGVPIVPVSQVGAFALQNPGKSRLDPVDVTVIYHDPIVTMGMSKQELDELPERVREIVRLPVEEGTQADAG